MIPQMDFNSKEYYLSLWNGLFGAINGWSEEEVLRWAKAHAIWWSALDNPDDIFFHETPMYWACYSLIPDSLRA